MTNPLVLLHGALGCAANFAPLQTALDYPCHTLDFEGHGNTPTTRPFRIEYFAENVLAYLDAHNIAQVDIFGYSMGGYVALYLASQQPERVGKIFTLATKFAWTPDAAAQETRFLDPERILAKVPAYATALEAQHGATWRDVLVNTAEMMTHLGNQPTLNDDLLKTINHQVRIGLGDKDAMVSFEETLAVYRQLPNAQCQVLPATQHPIDRVDPVRLAQAIRDFFGLA